MTGIDVGSFAPSAIEKAHAHLLERARIALGKLSTAELHQVIRMSEAVSDEEQDA